MDTDLRLSDPPHLCPYCGKPLSRPTDVDRRWTTVASRLEPPTYVETRARDVNIGLALGLVVVLIMDVGVFVRRDFSPLGFGSNILVTAGLTVLLALWYWRMRVDTAETNAESYAAYEKRMETWQHTWYCARCDAVFVRD
jgi:tetrahydromethanopterin S-methyltransferase subunit E